jgi:hypothetical protein
MPVKPITEKETYRWVETIAQAKQVLPDTHLVMVGDRESDIYEVFKAGKELGVGLLVRTSQNRLLRMADGNAKLFDTAAQGDIVTTYETDVPVDAHKTRTAVLTVRTTAIQLPPPKSRDRNKERPSIPLNVLHVSEETPQESVQPISWMLTTSLQVSTSVEAVQKVQWYMYRWRIERFHYTLKTGAFNIEKLQFETADRFTKAIAMYSLVAVRERLHSNESAGTFFSQHELQAIASRTGKRATMLTLHEAMTATAQLGGYTQ